MQSILAALKACPKDADVQKWGCQALASLFGDPLVAAPHRQAGVEAVLRALAVLQDVETALKSMGIVAAQGAEGRKERGASGEGATGGGPSRARGRWARAMKKVGVVARSL